MVRASHDGRLESHRRPLDADSLSLPAAALALTRSQAPPASPGARRNSTDRGPSDLSLVDDRAGVLPDRTAYQLARPRRADRHWGVLDCGLCLAVTGQAVAAAPRSPLPGGI